MKMNSQYSLPQAKPQSSGGNRRTTGKNSKHTACRLHGHRRTQSLSSGKTGSCGQKGRRGSKTELILYGTMIQDDVQYAFIEDKKNPKNNAGSGNPSDNCKKGRYNQWLHYIGNRNRQDHADKG
jgi:hypothetical protein